MIGVVLAVAIGLLGLAVVVFGVASVKVSEERAGGDE